MEEVWKDVEGFEGLYQVSNLGRLKSYKKDGSGHIYKLTNKNGDYFRVVLYGTDGKRKSYGLHRLIAGAFIENPFGYKEINHIDSNKQNNRIENLEWCSREYNAEHARKHNPNMLDGMIWHNKHVRAKPVYQFTKKMEFVRQYPSAAEASRETGVCSRNILQVASHACFKVGHERKTAGGYIWRFEEEVMLDD